MQQLKAVERVYGLSKQFLTLRQEVENLLIRGEEFFSTEYLENMKIRYNTAYLSCLEYLERERCKQCLIAKLRSLELDQYTMDLYDPDSDDGGVEM